METDVVSGQNRFRIDLPKGWEDQTVHIFRGPEEGGLGHSLMLVVDRHLQHKDIVSFAREKTNPITSNMDSIEVLKDEDVTIKGGNAAYEFVYKWAQGDGQATFMKYVFVIKDDLGFTFSAGFSKRTLKTVGTQLGDTIEAILPGTYEPLEEE